MIKELTPLIAAQSIFLQNVAKLILYINSLEGYTCTAGELYRTEEQQAIYYKKKLSRTMQSAHRQRLAVDLNIFYQGIYAASAEKYRLAAEFWHSLHPKNQAGYFWGWDSNHFEMKL